MAAVLAIPTVLFGQEAEEEAVTVDITGDELAELMAYMQYADSVEQTLNYQAAGSQIELGDGIASLNVPEGFKYLNPEQSEFVLMEIWGNPGGSGTLGMIFPDSASVFDDGGYSIVITYDEMGYVSDEDAEDLDYDDLLEEMQDDTEESSRQRIEMGYESVELIGWASQPFYDSEEKKLHWAKELQFGETEGRTLNYNVRVLGRKGVLEMNFIAGIEDLDQVQTAIPEILPAANFNDGNRYRDFDPSIDEVAAVGIGGLIAGKVLAKTGILALLGKFGKVIIAAVVGGFALLRKRLFGSKDEA